jgi:hypothetical protein
MRGRNFSSPRYDREDYAGGFDGIQNPNTFEMNEKTYRQSRQPYTRSFSRDPYEHPRQSRYATQGISFGAPPPITTQTQKDEVVSDYWYTPENVLKSIYNILPNAFDPCPIAPEFDGLTEEWPENCFINPPFSQIREFIAHAKKQWTPGKNFVWLINADFKTDIGQEILQNSNVVALTKNPISFRPGHPALRAVGNKWNSVLCLWSLDESTIEHFKQELANECTVLQRQ